MIVFQFPILLDLGNRVMDRYSVTLIPTPFMIGRDGELLGQAFGPKNGEEAVGIRLLNRWIGVSRKINRKSASLGVSE